MFDPTVTTDTTHANDATGPRAGAAGATDSSKRRRTSTRQASPCIAPNPPGGRSTPEASQETLAPTSGTQHDRQGRRVPLSCGECRRLKLKCDRVFPCKQCVKRGCAEICPDGSLMSGKGSRFILANTEHLHEKIVQMSDRIRQLEDAIQRSLGSSHPLLSPELLHVKSTLELYNGVAHNQPSAPQVLESTTAVPPSNRRRSPTPYAETAPLLMDDTFDDRATAVAHIPSLPSNVAFLSACFPQSWRAFPGAPDNGRFLIRDLLPSRADAQYLCDQARENAFWQYAPDPSEDFLADLMGHVYASPLSALCPRRMSMLFMVLALGSSVDLQRDMDKAQAERYYQLARAALCEHSVLEDTSVDCIIALFFMVWYLQVFQGGKGVADMTWTITGLMARAAQSIGLHREQRNAAASVDDVQRQRAIFWELMNLDARLSLSLGRPPALAPQYSDCKKPHSSQTVGSSDGTALYHDWKFQFLTRCMSPVLDATTSAQPPKYAAIISLDRTIRDFPAPAALQMPSPSHADAPVGLTMQRALVSIGRDILLMQLHRMFFTQALSVADGFAWSHRYAASVLATYHDAGRAILALESLHQQAPELSVRFALFWSNAFSAAVALCLFVSRTPFCDLSTEAFSRLETCVDVFRRARARCAAAQEKIDTLENLVSSARQKMTRLRAGSLHPYTTGGAEQPRALAHARAAPPALEPRDAHPILIALHARARSPVLWSADAFEGQHPVPIAVDALLPPPHPQPDSLAHWDAFASPGTGLAQGLLPLMDGIAPQAFDADPTQAFDADPTQAFDAEPRAGAQGHFGGTMAVNTLGISFEGDEWMSMF